MLKSFPISDGAESIFLLPEDAMHSIYKFIIKNKLRNCIELGTCYGSTACVMSAAVQELEGGRVVTNDKHLLQPSIMTIMQHVGLSEDKIEVIVDHLGYNWYMADLIQEQTNRAGVCVPIFDFCLIDGAHEWSPDSLAFFLIAKLLKPGGWIAIDDINFNLKMIPNLQETPYANYSNRELDTFQMKMVYDLVVRQHPDFNNFHISHKGRIGWAQKALNKNDDSEVKGNIMGTLKNIFKSKD